MPDPKLIDSPLSRVVEEDGERVEILIYRLEDEVMEWSLEIVASDGCAPRRHQSLLTPCQRRAPRLFSVRAHAD